MTATNKLRALLVSMGFTQSEIADKIGISRQSFSYKINNKVEFKVSEIEAICQLLHIEDKDEYFFAA
ncbi:MAG: helix-turn-helix domain-containing protein [Faecalibacterium sp.]|nr:helix-turn-helix domain-containing protein [Ruminococcus sp.]MCM1392476.1 helix-turn-helix domain-containing protein [Ruminococcus sp.]MCM1486209.1 helix-turn-helix domain-containing protein [Faecalibacterium sp.]